MSNDKNKGGRPKKDEEISIDEIIDIMIDSSKSGRFFCNLPGQIYMEKNIMVSLSYLEKIKDERFLRARSVSAAICSQYWTEMAAQAAVQTGMWKYIMSNVVKWSENNTVQVSDADLDKKTDMDAPERKARIELIKKMAKEIK